MNELANVFEPGEYGPRDGGMRGWHTKARLERERSIAAHPGGQHTFNVYAGTGAGKTHWAGLCASVDLNLGRVRRVVVVVYTLPVLDRTREVFRKHFGVHLAEYDGRRHRHGVTSDQQGYILTYAALARKPKTHRKITSYEPTLVIFDEVHHLGDNESCGEAAKLAFGEAPYVVTMTGSPFRPNSTGTIAFANYDPVPDQPGILRYRACYSYPLGKAIAEGHCREPEFRFCDDAEVDITPAGSDRVVRVSFRDQLSDTLASLRLQGAVKYGAVSRTNFLRRAIEQCRAEGRKVIIFLGGDTVDGRTPTDDAHELLPGELNAMGVGSGEIAVITGRTKAPHLVMRKFQASETQWVMITVNRISEGADCPELSAAIFLTTWTSDLSFIQRLGRILRYRGPGDFATAVAYLFAHPSSVAAAEVIKAEFKAHQAVGEQRERREPQVGDGGPPAKPAQAIGISGGEITMVVRNGHRYRADLDARVQQMLKAQGLSMAYYHETYLTLAREASDVGTDRNDARKPA